MRSFIVGFWARIFSLLRWISLFQVVSFCSRKFFNKRITYGFVDIWVVGNLALSLLFVWIVSYTNRSVLWTILLIYGFMRVFEVIVYQTNVLLFDHLRGGSNYTVRSYRRIVILLLHNFCEIILWFAASYIVLANSFINTDSMSMLSTIYSSFVITTGFGITKLEPNSSIGLYIIWAQSFSGLFLTLVSLSRFIGLLPTPKSMDREEQEAD